MSFLWVCIFLFTLVFFIPPRKKVIGVLLGSNDNQQAGPNVEYISMHAKGIESSGKANQPENRNIVTAIEDLKRFQAAM